MIVAVAVGRKGIDTLLVASQVLLSVVLPFVAFPLIYLTSSEKVMRVRKPDTLLSSEANNGTEGGLPLAVTNGRHSEELVTAPVSPPEDIEKLNEARVNIGDGFLDFTNPKFVTCLAYAVWCVVLVANAYAIAMLIVDGGQASADFD